MNERNDFSVLHCLSCRFRSNFQQTLKFRSFSCMDGPPGRFGFLVCSFRSFFSYGHNNSKKEIQEALEKEVLNVLTIYAFFLFCLFSIAELRAVRQSGGPVALGGGSRRELLFSKALESSRWKRQDISTSSILSALRERESATHVGQRALLGSTSFLLCRLIEDAGLSRFMQQADT